MATKKKGGRNLLILSGSVVVLSVAITALNLHLYRSSGDIYLDRSRPGYISEGEKHDDKDDELEEFKSDGAIDKRALKEYLEYFDAVYDRMEKSGDAFDDSSLSDEALGISSPQESKKEAQ